MLVRTPIAEREATALSAPKDGGLLRVEVLRDLADLPGLRSAWIRLAAGSRSASAAQSYEYAAAACHAGTIGTAELAVISIWRGDRMLCVWPLQVGRNGGRRIATHLGTGCNEEYAGPLILEDASAPQVAALALTAALRLADVVEIYATDPQSPLVEAVRSDRHIKYRNRIRSPAVGLRCVPGFDEWLAGKSKSFRQGLGYERRRLAKIGELTFVPMAGADGQRVVEWLFAGKRELLAGRGKTGSWVFQPQGEAMLQRLVHDEASDVFGHALCLDGRIIAGSICFRSSHAIEFFMTGFDPAFSAYSPGNLLIEDLCRLAADENRDFDFRVTQDAYKMRWADTFAERETIIIAATARGVLRAVRLTVERAIRDTRRALKASAKRALSKLRRSAKP